MNALLLSGGMDSTCIAWWKRPNLAIFIDYGQKPAEAEELAAKTVCEEIEIELEVVRVDCSALGSGDMAGTPSLDIAPVPEWWPYRNQLLLTIAGACALRFGVSELLIGALKTDSQHADGTIEFVDAMSKVMALQEGSISITAPAIGLSAEELVKVSEIPKSTLGWAHSCHIGNLACGQCRGCKKHFSTWKNLGWTAH